MGERGAGERGGERGREEGLVGAARLVIFLSVPLQVVKRKESVMKGVGGSPSPARLWCSSHP